MKRLIPAVLLLGAACAGHPVKPAPVAAIGCGPTQHTRALSPTVDVILKLCYMTDGSVKWEDGDAIARPAPAAPAPAAAPAPIVAKKKRHHK